MLYTIKLVSFNNDEILIIDSCMRVCGLDMTAAAKCVDNMPSVLLKNIDEEKVEEVKKEFEAVGAVLQIISADEEAALEPDEEVNIGSSNVEPSNMDENLQNYDYSDVQYNHSSYSDYNDVYSQSNYYSDQGYDGQEYNEQIYGNQGYDNQVYGNQGYEGQGYATQEYNNLDYNNQNYDNQGYGDNYNFGIQDEFVNNGHEYTNANVEKRVEEDKENVAKTSDGNNRGYSESNESNIMDIMNESCPKCGSTFISVKKSNGIFGNQKLKYICDACKHKF